MTTEYKSHENFSTSSHILMRRHGAVGIIEMNRPDFFNALNVEMARDLRKAAIQFARDQEVRAVILSGQKNVFCSGADLKYVRARGQAEDRTYLHPSGAGNEPSFGQSFKEILEYIHSTISEIRRAPKPFLAAVNGIAAAGGFGLAMSCDLVIASELSSFEWAYHKTGLTGAESSTFFIARLLGLRRAFDFAFLNPRLGAQEAFLAGLVSRVLPVDRFDQEVLLIASSLAEGPTKAMGIAKMLINEAAGMDKLDFHLDKELRKLVQIADGPDFAKGLAAFFAKTKPQFKGNCTEENLRD